MQFIKIYYLEGKRNFWYFFGFILKLLGEFKNKNFYVCVCFGLKKFEIVKKVGLILQFFKVFLVGFLGSFVFEQRVLLVNYVFSFILECIWLVCWFRFMFCECFLLFRQIFCVCRLFFLYRYVIFKVCQIEMIAVVSGENVGVIQELQVFMCCGVLVREKEGI